MAALVVLGGYLGSGKTTLLNRVLAEAGDARIAVVVNDFGKINIDAELVERRHEDIVEFANGCICCRLSDDATPLMQELAARPDLDHVLVELSGVALPRSFTAWGTVPGLEPGPVIVCADSTTVRSRAADPFVGDVVTAQLEQADRIVISKTDLLSPASAERVNVWLQETFPRTPIGLASDQDLLDHPLSGRTTASTAHLDHDLRARSDHADKRFVSARFEDRDVRDIGAFAAVLHRHKSHLERAKGFVRDAAGHTWLVQLSGTVIDVAPTKEPGSTASEFAAEYAFAGGHKRPTAFVLLTKAHDGADELLDRILQELGSVV